MSRQAPGITKGSRAAQGTRRLLTFRLDQEQRQRLKARLARDGRTMSEVVTHGLRQYVQHARPVGSAESSPKNAVLSPKGRGKLVLPDRVAARRERQTRGHER